MKRRTAIMALLAALVLVIACFSALAEDAGVKIDKANFPSKVLRKYVSKHFDANGDGELSEAERKAVKKIVLYTEADLEKGKALPKCGSLKGVEWFPNLKQLRAPHCSVTFVDVRKNRKLTLLELTENPGLDSIDVSKNTKLTELKLGDCGLKKLNVKKNTALKTLSVYRNRLKALDVTRNAKLTELECSGNKLTKLDVSKNRYLVGLGCSSNKLTTLNLGKNAKLKWLSCGVNRLTKLDVSHNAKLVTLFAEGNPFRTLDIQKNIKLLEHIRDCEGFFSESYYDDGLIASWYTDEDTGICIDYRVKLTAGDLVLFEVEFNK